MKLFILKVAWVLACLPCPISGLAPAEAGSRTAPRPVVFFTDESQPDRASRQFSCYAGPVNAFVLFPERISGRHVLEGRWLKPDGAIQERILIARDLAPPGEQAFRLWLRFHAERPGVADLLFPDMDNEEFDGEWNLNVFWDGDLISASTFTVRCG